MAAAQQIEPRAAGAELQFPLPLKFDANFLSAPTSNTAAAVTAAADASRPNAVQQIFCSYSAAPTGGAVQVEDGSGTVVWKQLLAGAGPHVFPFDPPLVGTANTALIVTLAAGGSGVSGALYASLFKLT